MKLKRGTKVAWKSQSKGYNNTKLGVVLEVVPAGYVPVKNAFKRQFSTWPMKHCENAGGRSTESYVVAVENGDNKPKVYWPRVENLIIV